MASCDHILTETGNILTTEDGFRLVTEDSVCGGVVTTFTPTDGFLLRPLQRPMMGLQGY